MTIKERKEQYKNINATNANINFYELQKKRSREFPDEFDNNLQYVLLEAGRQTQEFMYFVSDVDHAEHKACIKEYASKYECSVDKVGDHFRAIELAKYAIDKKAIIETCIEAGKNKAEHFVKSMLDVNHENHISNVAIFKTKYKEIPDQIENDFIEEQLQKRGYKSLPVRDAEYEKSLSTVPAGLNQFQLTSFKSLQELYSLKWQTIGSTGDDIIYQQFISESVSIPGLKFSPKH